MNANTFKITPQMLTQMHECCDILTTLQDRMMCLNGECQNILKYLCAQHDVSTAELDVVTSEQNERMEYHEQMLTLALECESHSSFVMTTEHQEFVEYHRSSLWCLRNSSFDLSSTLSSTLSSDFSEVAS